MTDPITYTVPYPPSAPDKPTIVWMPCKYKDCRAEPYKLLKYSIDAYGIWAILYPAEPSPAGDIPIHRKLTEVYATQEEVEAHVRKCCANCAKSQKGFFVERRTYCGKSKTQMVCVDPEYVCEEYEAEGASCD
jgi:hypothetical protein